MFHKGLTILALLPAFAVGQICIPFLGTCVSNSAGDSAGTSWLSIVSCTANQVPQLPDDFSMPMYQFLFEVLAKNTHLLPLGVPIKSESEDFDTTLAYEKCLWGPHDEDNTIDGSPDEESSYNQLFQSRTGGYDPLTGFSLLGGKIVAAMVGYIFYVL